MNNRYCVIMCGGIGSRFWPYSRASHPKQFIDFMGTGQSLLQMSAERMRGVVGDDNIVVVANEAYLGLIQEQLPYIKSKNILLEPARRNTAPCIAWAVKHILAQNVDASIMVCPSDHLIMKQDAFRDCIIKGFEFVESHEALLTLGIQPSHPETGYGYIQVGEKEYDNILRVKTFTEKPNLELAKVFLESGDFFWNSGIFLWSASTIDKALHLFASGVTDVLDKGDGLYSDAEKEKKFINDNFANCQNISIDFAVMEKAKNVYVQTVDIGWSDLGTWGSLYENSAHDADNNAARKCILKAYDSTGNIIASSTQGKAVVAVGLKNYIVADTDDVLLICPLSEEQRIKHFVSDITAEHGDKFN